jgi:uncharacterized protein YkwD
MRIGTGILIFILLSACSASGATKIEPGPGSAVGAQVETDQDPGSGLSELEAAATTTAEALLTSVNLRRALSGVPPLIQQPELTGIANDRAAEMATSGYMGHVDPQSGMVVVEQRLQQAGYHGQAAELLLDSLSPLSELAEITARTWFADADHELILLGPTFRYAGIGVMGDGKRWIVVTVLTGDLP